MPPRPQLNEDIWFIHDNETDPIEKNMLVASYLAGGAWGDLQIVRIKRIEIGNTGWLAKYRTRPRSRGGSRSSTASP